MHPLAFYLLLLPLGAEANLFKCTDNAGKVTYTNSPCVKVGLKENKVIPPPPPPALDAPKPKVEQTAKAAIEKVEPVAKPKQTAALQLMKSTHSNSGECAKLNADMGRTMDEMDAARGQGMNSKKQAEWNSQLKLLQTEKSRLGCF